MTYFLLYINSYNGHLYAIDHDTGCLIWRFRPGDNTNSSLRFEVREIKKSGVNRKLLYTQFIIFVNIYFR